MIIKENFHTHTTFCDGKESAEQMVLAALEKGFTALGFSGHSYTHFDTSYCMSKEDSRRYVDQIRELKEKYRERIKLYVGIEQDFYSTEPTDAYDYAIVSVHYLLKDGIYYPVDESEEIFLQSLREGFQGDYLQYAKAFFGTVGQIAKRSDVDFVGHFDLLTKFNEGSKHFDLWDRRYLSYAVEAIECLCKADIPFEVNTGGMYRGLRSEPYPSLPLLKEIKMRNGRVVISSDSHDTASLGYCFEKVEQTLRELGFSSVLLWREGGFIEKGIRI